MSKGLSIVLSLVVGLLIGWFAHVPSSPPVPVPAPNPTVVIADTPTPVPSPIANGSVAVTVLTPPDDDTTPPDVRPEKAVIGSEDFVFWASKTKKKFIRIEFKDRVFANMTQLSNGRYALGECKKRRCFSDDVIATPGDYKYWQISINPNNKKEVEKDGWIIIVK